MNDRTVPQPGAVQPDVTQPILRAQNIVKRFGPVTALRGVSFDLQAGEIHSLCGENGAGKSTLIKTLSGIHAFGSYEGELFLDGAPLRLKSIADAEKAGIAVIYQELALVDGTSRVGQTGIVFHNTLFDENAGCHVAWGQSFPFAVDGGPAMSEEQRAGLGLNTSAVHTDVVIGGDGITVTGRGPQGTVEIIREDAWVL